MGRGMLLFNREESVVEDEKRERYMSRRKFIGRVSRGGTCCRMSGKHISWRKIHS